MIFELSKPPALNRLYGNNRFGGKYLKAEGRKWQLEAITAISAMDPVGWGSPLQMFVELYTCRHQDNDGILKLLQDTLQKAGVYSDDYWIFDLRVVKYRVRKEEEKIVVKVSPQDPEDF